MQPLCAVWLQNRLKEKGLRSSQLKQELDLLQTVSVCESLDWAKCASLELLQTALAWQVDIEAALEQCGVNVKIADDSGLLFYFTRFNQESFPSPCATDSPFNLLNILISHPHHPQIHSYEFPQCHVLSYPLPSALFYVPLICPVHSLTNSYF